MNLDFAILAGGLAAIYGGMKVIMDTVYVINGKRDLILDLDEDGVRLDRSRKCHLLYTDVKPLIIGLSLFLAVYTSAFIAMGLAIHLEFYNGVMPYVGYFLFAAGAASLYALWIVITKNHRSFVIMREFVRDMPESQSARPIACCRGTCRWAPIGDNPQTVDGEESSPANQ